MGQGIVSGSLTDMPAAMRGYSAYEVAVQLGYKGTEREWIESLSSNKAARVSSLNDRQLASDTVIETAGIPVYISDVEQYADFGLTATGWYVFARIVAPAGVSVTAETRVEGAAGHIAAEGEGHVDVAVRFDVAAISQKVIISWGDITDEFVFKSTDLAVRNLDYRTTFYVYDLADFVTWEFALTTDSKFAAGKRYFTLSEDGAYVEAEVIAGETVPADTYYVHSKVRFEGMARNITYKLDEMIDCPIEIVLPVIANDGHGAWFEFQLRYDKEYSCTLLPMDSEARAGTAVTQKQKAGINIVDLHYTEVFGAKIWTLINTHSDIPTA